MVGLMVQVSKGSPKEPSLSRDFRNPNHQPKPLRKHQLTDGPKNHPCDKSQRLVIIIPFRKELTTKWFALCPPLISTKKVQYKCFKTRPNRDMYHIPQMFQNYPNPFHQQIPHPHLKYTTRRPCDSIPNEEPQKQWANGNLLNQDFKKQIFVRSKNLLILHPRMAQRKTTANHNQKFGSLLGELQQTSFSFQIPCQRFLFWSIPSSVPACRYGESLLLSHHSLEVPAGVVKFGDPP